MSEFALQKNTPLGFADLGLLATVELQIIHVFDKSRVVVLSTDNREIRDTISRIYSSETSAVQTLQSYYPIIHVQFNQSIDPRPEYIRVIIIEWSIKSSIPVAHIVSPDTQRSLISARRCEGLDGYSQQVY
ncbi:unnamed protein product [Rotaria magnacalcarata]|uniref:Uncharacterized protein n=2 Tax=Rotaria magnacalcarata TaxID=392030 RepID=A0A816R5F3_9BILA|nr:unnamed protein product [Rotaria magnacalcarata]CAF4630753.1 unnamed protein product [Rotaria magnacalcarata]CAF5056860.1 unnamed protein product [Rotaria magnacalcarata]